MFETIAVVGLVLAGLSVVLHLIPAKDIHSAPIAKAQADIDSVYDWLVNHLSSHPALSIPAIQPVPAPNVTHTVTVAAPAGTIVPAPPAPDNVNGVAVPAGMDVAGLTALVGAIQGASAMLNNPAMHDALVHSTNAWWASLGRFYREALKALASGDTLLFLQSLVGQPDETVTAAQWTAAHQAAGL